MINRQAKATAVCSILNLMPYQVTAIQEWAYVYNVRIVGKGWRFVSKKKVDAYRPAPNGKAKTLASSHTLEGLTRLINQYYYSEGYAIDPLTLTITHPTRSVPDNVRVLRLKGRYYFKRYTKDTRTFSTRQR